MKSQSTDFRTNERRQSLKRTYLYRFLYGATNYYWAGYDQDISVAGGPVAKMTDPQTFTSAQIAHTKPEESMDANPGLVVVSLSALDAELRKYFIAVSPRRIDVEIWRVSSAALPGPLDYTDDLKMVFKGIVDSISFDDLVVQANCITQLLREDMPIPRFFYQKMCNHIVYDQTPGSCQLNPALFEVSLTVDTLNRASGYIEFNSLTAINVDSPARSVTITAETFQGGSVTDSLGNEMGIMVCEPLTGPTRVRIWLVWMPRTLAAAQTVTLRVGCMYIKRYCHSVMQNLPRFGGTPYIPVSNPATDGVA